MTARHPDKTKEEHSPRFVLPHPPDRDPEDMTSFKHLTRTGIVACLAHHFSAPETTIIDGERYIIREPGAPADERRRPDLVIAFNVNAELYEHDNGYIISHQGKPPDFVLEIASPSTGRRDTGRKRNEYAQLGVAEYWRFDETGQFHGVNLAGDLLVGGEYQPLAIQVLEDGALQGYSLALKPPPAVG